MKNKLFVVEPCDIQYPNFYAATLPISRNLPEYVESVGVGYHKGYHKLLLKDRLISWKGDEIVLEDIIAEGRIDEDVPEVVFSSTSKRKGTVEELNMAIREFVEAYSVNIMHQEADKRREARIDYNPFRS